MTHSEIHNNFESKCRQIIGCTVKKVQYAEIDYYPDNPEPCYKSKYSEIDTVDFSVSLFTSDNGKIEAFWDDEFYSYGVGIKINEKSVFNDNRKWDVSIDPMWQKCIGQQIIDLNIYWDETWIETHQTGIRNYYTYPLALGFVFTNKNKVIISAGEFNSTNYETAYTGMDNLLVTANEKLALTTKMISQTNR